MFGWAHNSRRFYGGNTANRGRLAAPLVLAAVNQLLLPTKSIVDYSLLATRRWCTRAFASTRGPTSPPPLERTVSDRRSSIPFRENGETLNHPRRRLSVSRDDRRSRRHARWGAHPRRARLDGRFTARTRSCFRRGSLRLSVRKALN